MVSNMPPEVMMVSYVYGAENVVYWGKYAIWSHDGVLCLMYRKNVYWGKYAIWSHDGVLCLMYRKRCILRQICHLKSWWCLMYNVQKKMYIEANTSSKIMMVSYVYGAKNVVCWGKYAIWSHDGVLCLMYRKRCILRQICHLKPWWCLM